MIEETYAAVSLVKASPTWVLSNHDVTREVTRYGGGQQGVDRSKAATLTMLALPGSSYLYQGGELGLPEVELAPAHRHDPAWFRSGAVGRDGCRVPIPWSGTKRPYGFSSDRAAASWLPQPRAWRRLSVEAQDQDPGSTLNFFRRALACRRVVCGSLDQTVDLRTGAPGVLVVHREPGFTCVLNCSKRDFALSKAGELGSLVIASRDEIGVRDGVLPADTAAWFRR